MEPERSWSLESLVGEVRADVRHVQTDMTEVRGDVRHLQTDVSELRQDVRLLEGRQFQFLLVQLATLATTLASLVVAVAAG